MSKTLYGFLVFIALLALFGSVEAQDKPDREVKAEPPEYKDPPAEVSQVESVVEGVLNVEYLPPPELAEHRQLWESVRQDTNNVKLLYDLGNAYYDEGRRTPSKRAFEQAVKRDPRHLPSRVNLGVVLNELGETDGAIRHLEMATELSPDDLLALCNLGLAYYAKDLTAKAVDMYLKALSIDPESQLAHYNLGVAFADAGIYKEAIFEWEAVVQAGPTSDAAKQAQDNIRVLRNIMRQGE
jgi:tetratricopeptide (TPR) repeat protein